MIQRALDEDRPYAMAFVDMRMPPGCDGRETVRRAWEIAPDLQAVICTAYSDHQWEDIQQALGSSDRLIILKKPFDQIEVMQLALALTEKWNLGRLAQLKTEALEEQVRIRTQELVYAQQSKSNFLRKISLELLTPMNGILRLADLMEEAATTETQKELVSGLQKSSHRLMELLGDVLTYNTIEAGQLELRRVTFDVRQFCQTALDGFEEKARARGLGLTLNVAAEFPGSVESDPKQLRSILAILLDNAIKYSHQGTVQLRAQMAPSDSSMIEIAVVDQGEGISPEDLARLKLPLNQIDGSPTQTGCGASLRLTVAKQLVELMGLELAMESQVGQGSIFSVKLPLIFSQTSKKPAAVSVPGQRVSA